MKLRQLHEGIMGEVGHILADLAGFIPVAGEPIDLLHGVQYYRQGQYFTAALYIISLIPDVGDAIGKGIKYLGRGSKLANKLTPVVAKYADDILRLVRNMAKNEKVRELMPEFEEKIVPVIKELIEEAQQPSEQAEPANV